MTSGSYTSVRMMFGASSPHTMLSSVDLPQPLGPTTVRNSPALTSRLTPAIAWIVLPRVMKSRETSLSESIVMARLRWYRNAGTATNQ